MARMGSESKVHRTKRVQDATPIFPNVIYEFDRLNGRVSAETIPCTCQEADRKVRPISKQLFGKRLETRYWTGFKDGGLSKLICSSSREV
jgi:hypothetical protein